MYVRVCKFLVIVLFGIVSLPEAFADSIEWLKLNGDIVNTEYTSQTLFDIITQNNVESFELVDSVTRRSIHQLQIIRNNNLPVAIRFDNHSTFSLSSFIEYATTRRHEIENMNHQERIDFLYPKVEETMQDLIEHLSTQIPFSRLNDTSFNKTNKAATIRVEWSHRGLAIVLDILAASFTFAGGFFPIPILPEIVFIKYASKPLAERSQKHYEVANLHRSIRLQNYNAKTFKPISLRIIELFEKAGHFVGQKFVIGSKVYGDFILFNMGSSLKDMTLLSQYIKIVAQPKIHRGVEQGKQTLSFGMDRIRSVLLFSLAHSSHLNIATSIMTLYTNQIKNSAKMTFNRFAGGSKAPGTCKTIMLRNTFSSY